MRNLKRVLSLALALVMVLGMMVITTSAADFTDAEEITYKEAVDVISALGIINGFEAADGTFYFDGGKTLTREQGAKIVCYLLMGKEDADQLVGSGEFTDVAADRWSAGSIDYCAAHGILAGMGDGTFDPEGTLTIVQYAKMLLCALGYDAKVEGYVGTNWATAIVTDMIAASLKVKDVDVDAVLTREIAAQMTLQALEGYTVSYPDGKGTDIKLADGTTITIGAGEAKPGEDALYETLEYAELSKDTVLAKNNGGLAGYQWNLVGATDPIYEGTTESVKASYESGAKFADIVKALGVKNTSTKTYDVEVYTNGVWTKGVYSVVAEDTFVDMDNATGATLIAEATAFKTIPNGCSVDVVVTKNAAKETVIRLLVTVPYLAYVDKNSDVADNDQDDDDERTVTIKNALYEGHSYTLTPEDPRFEAIYAVAAAIPATSDAKVYYNVVPMGNPAADEAAATVLLSIESATTVTGKMTSYNAAAGTYTIGEKAYQLSATATVNAETMQALAGKDANFVLDAQGFINFASEVPGAQAPAAVYAYLRRLVKVTPVAENTGAIDEADAADPYLQAELVFTDGSVKIVTVDTLVHGSGASILVYGVGEKNEGTDAYGLAYKTASSAWQDLTSATTFEGIFMNQFVSYVVDEDGVYTLTSATNASASGVTLANKVVFASGKVANAKTVFVVETSKEVSGRTVYSYNVYTGYANLPANTFNSAAIDVLTKDGVATYVYVVTTLKENDGSVEDETLYFVTGDPTFNYVESVPANTKNYYEYPVLIDGVASTIKVAANDIVAKGNMYTVEKIDANGYVAEVAPVAMEDYIVVKAADSIVKLNTGWATYDENTKVTVIENGEAKEVAITDLKALENALYVTYVPHPVTGEPTDMIAEIVATSTASLVPEVTSAVWNTVDAGAKKYNVTTTFAEDNYLPAGAMKVVLKNAQGAVIASATSIADHDIDVSADAVIICPFWAGEHPSDNWTAGHQNLGDAVTTAKTAEVYLFGQLVETVTIGG